MRNQVPTPNTGTGWLWLAAGLFAAFTFASKGGEFQDGFDRGYNGDTPAEYAGATAETSD